MADQAIVHIGENSPEYVAYRLMHEIALVEGREIVSLGHNVTEPKTRADRQWILDTYAERLFVVRRPGTRLSSKPDVGDQGG